MSIDKNNSPSNRDRAIKQGTKIVAKRATPARARMDNQRKTKMPSHTMPPIEQEYVRLFSVPQAPQPSFYADDYSLEQPSALKYVQSTTSPNAEV